MTIHELRTADGPPHTAAHPPVSEPAHRSASESVHRSASESARPPVDEDPTPRPASGPAGPSRGWASVTACPDGPLLVRGDVEILLADGSPAPRRRSTVALCRCGASGIKPYCDGSHKVVGFRTDDEPATITPVTTTTPDTTEPPAT